MWSQSFFTWTAVWSQSHCRSSYAHIRVRNPGWKMKFVCCLRTLILHSDQVAKVQPDPIWKGNYNCKTKLNPRNWGCLPTKPWPPPKHEVRKTCINWLQEPEQNPISPSYFSLMHWSLFMHVLIDSTQRLPSMPWRTLGSGPPWAERVNTVAYLDRWSEHVLFSWLRCLLTSLTRRWL